jgi:hypothetical protein
MASGLPHETVRNPIMRLSFPCLGILLMANLTAADPDLGSQVIILDPTMDAATIQSACDKVFTTQFSNQFGKERYAILFKPGTYSTELTVGFYTQVAGLGRLPGDVVVRGLKTKAFEVNTNVTQNFWRTVENFTVQPPSGKSTTWAVSQAAPMRRMHIKSELRLFIGGWASGGFMADTQVDGQVVPGSQQQWLSRNCAWNRWAGGVWNMAYMGCENTPAPAPWGRKHPHTVEPTTPVVREKPFLTIDKDGEYAVFVPEAKRDSRGPGWLAGPEAGKSVPLADFYIAKPAKDTAASLNQALQAGKHLLFTPGIYDLDASLKIDRPGTIVMGLGLATLHPIAGTPAVTVADVDNVTLASLLVDAGKAESPTLIQVGPQGSSADHRQSPTYLYDIFCRVGGAGAANTLSAVEVNSHDVIGDHTWIWRADHGEGADWNSTRSKNGLIVRGDRVKYYGLFVEHFQEYQTIWEGEDGQMFFYQCEIPYDVPSTEAWTHDGVKGWAAYKVGDRVQRHQAKAMGIYSFFRDAPVIMDRTIETPELPTVSFTNMIGFWLLGKEGAVVHRIINDAGDASTKDNREVRLISYPIAK